MKKLTIIIICLLLNACSISKVAPKVDTSRVSENLEIVKASDFGNPEAKGNLREVVNVSDLSSLKVWPEKMFVDVPEYDPWLKLHRPSNKALNIPIKNVGGIRILDVFSKGTPKTFNAEIAKKWQYWMTNEVRRIFASKDFEGYERAAFKTHKAMPLDLLPAPSQKKQVIEAFLKRHQPNISSDVVDKAYNACVNKSGKGNILILKKDELIKKYTGCLRAISEYMTNPSEEAMSALDYNGYSAYPYNKLVIEKHIVYDKKRYDAKFVEHVQGKYGSNIKYSLMHPRKSAIYVAFTSSVDSRYHLNKDYFSKSLSTIAFNSYTMGGLFGIYDTNWHYRDYSSLVKSISGNADADLFSDAPRNLLRKVDARCYLNSEYLHLVHKEGVTRYAIKCTHNPVYMTESEWHKKKFNKHKSYSDYMDAIYLQIKAQTNVRMNRDYLTKSEVTYYQYNESNFEKSTQYKSGAFSSKKVDLEFVFNFDDMKVIEDVYTENFPMEEQDITGKNTSMMALHLLKRLPPNAMVSWIARSSKKSGDSSKSDSNYVYHHGVLWEFPRSDFYPEEH